jgi:hypothetical protein
MKQMQFTEAQKQAILHRLDIGECIAEVFADTDGMGHLSVDAAARARAMAQELKATGIITSDSGCELDREILIDCIDGSTWYAVHEGYGEASNQKLAAIVNALAGSAAIIEVFYGLEPGVITVVTE